MPSEPCRASGQGSAELDSELVGEFAAAGDPQLGVDCFEVVLHGVGGDLQPGGDLPGAQPGEYRADYFALAPGEAVGGGKERKDGRGARGPDHHADALGHPGWFHDPLTMQGDPLALAAADAESGWERR